MRKAIFLYRFHSLEPASTYFWKSSYSIRPGIFVHFLERVQDFITKMNIPFEFVCIIDNTTESLIPRTEKVLYDMLGRENTKVIRTELVDGRREDGVGQTNRRLLNNGNISTSYHVAGFTFFYTSMEELKERLDEDMIVFFCESDYLYTEDALVKGYKMADKYDEDFVTLYEHPNIYVFTLEQMAGSSRIFKNMEVDEFDHHWRTITSTCVTFIGSMKAIKKYPEFLLNAPVDWTDCGLWTNQQNDTRPEIPSQLWVAIPGLNFHYESHNTVRPEDEQYWRDLIQSMLTKNY